MSELIPKVPTESLVERLWECPACKQENAEFDPEKPYRVECLYCGKEVVLDIPYGPLEDGYHSSCVGPIAVHVTATDKQCENINFLSLVITADEFEYDDENYPYFELLGPTLQCIEDSSNFLMEIDPHLDWAIRDFCKTVLERLDMMTVIYHPGSV